MSGNRTIELAGTVLVLRADDAIGRDHLEWFFGAGGAPAGSPDLVVDVTQSALAVRPDVEPSMVDGPILRWHGDDSVVLWHESGMSAEVSPNAIVVSNATVDDRWRATRQLLFSALSWWFARYK